MIVILDEWNRLKAPDKLPLGEMVATLVGQCRINAVRPSPSDAVVLEGMGIYQEQALDHEVLTADGWLSYAEVAGGEREPVWLDLLCAARVLMRAPRKMPMRTIGVWGCYAAQIVDRPVRQDRHEIDGVQTYWESASIRCRMTYRGVADVCGLAVDRAGHYITQGGVVNRGIT